MVLADSKIPVCISNIAQKSLHPAFSLPYEGRLLPKQARGKMPHAQIELLINIEAKMRAGKGKGYERWAERHNTDVMASSMLYLIDNHISSYTELEHKIQSAVTPSGKAPKRNGNS